MVTADVVDEPVSPRNDDQSVKVEEWKPCAVRIGDAKSTSLEQLPKFRWTVVTTMADQLVERTLRTAWHGHHDDRTRREGDFCRLEKGGGIVEVFEHFAADRKARLDAFDLRWRMFAQEVNLQNRRVWNLLQGFRHADLTEFEPE